MSQKRKTPQRKCIVTNEMKPKKDMIRIVRNKDKEVFIDPSGKQNGRGAYMTMDQTVFERAQTERVLEKTFKVEIDPTLYEQLKDLISEQNNEK